MTHAASRSRAIAPRSRTWASTWRTTRVLRQPSSSPSRRRPGSSRASGPRESGTEPGCTPGGLRRGFRRVRHVHRPRYHHHTSQPAAGPSGRHRGGGAREPRRPGRYAIGCRVDASHRRPSGRGRVLPVRWRERGGAVEARRKLVAHRDGRERWSVGPTDLSAGRCATRFRLRRFGHHHQSTLDPFPQCVRLGLAAAAHVAGDRQRRADPRHRRVHDRPRRCAATVDGDFNCVFASDKGAYELQGQSNTPPSGVAIAGPAGAEAGQPVALVASAQDAQDGADALGFNWAFSDGGTASGASVSRVFASGDHQATVKVTDSQGCSATASRALAVASAADRRRPVISRVKARPRRFAPVRRSGRGHRHPSAAPGPACRRALREAEALESRAAALHALGPGRGSQEAGE